MTSSGALAGLSACECPVCFLTLSEDGNVPMSMPCGHTLCSACINQLVSKATSTSSQLGLRRVPTFQCPLCRDWVSRDAVQLNVTLRDLLVELSRIDKGPSSRQLIPTQHVNHSDIQFGNPIDRGAYGEVFRGVWQGNDVAIKVFSSGLLTPEGMASFQREVFVMNCLRHPNVVLLLGACQTPPKLSIIMEYVAGGSLHKLVHIDKVSLSSVDTATIGLGVCRGLQYLHSINILHRDLKSKNVLLTAPPPSGTAKLCDFGLARMRMESATMTGNVGTIHWSAPEVLSNQRYKFSADVYGLGMVLYEMATGRVPFQDMLPIAVMMAVALQKQQPEMPSSANPTIVEIINSCIQWDPVARCSVGSVITKLMKLLPKPQQSERPTLQHQDSLGVVFVSVTDSTDLANDNDNLVDIAKELGIVGHTHQQEVQGAVGGANAPDFVLAQQLQENEQEAQLARDRELAEQLQMTDFSYRTPSDEVPAQVTPPPKVLNSIKQVQYQKKTLLKSINEAPPTKLEAPPTEQDILLRMRMKDQSTFSKVSMSSLGPLTEGLSPPPPPPPPPVIGHKRTQVSRSHLPPPPAPPPPPPVVARPEMQRSISQIGRQRRMVEQVRVSGGKIASKLRPVQTIEKSAFRVGRVLDGYSSEAAQYTVQNQIRYFAHRLLRHVDLVEPPPAFPVGRIVPPKKGEKVKRVSRLFQTKKATPTKSKTTPNKIKTSEALKSFASKKIASNTRKVVHTRKTTPTVKLHSAIQSEIVSFSYSDLEPVEPKVKLTLPSARDIEREKAEMAEAMGNEQKTKKVVSNKSPLFAKKKAKLKSKKK